MSKRRARTVTIEASERLRARAETDGISMVAAVQWAVACWLDVRDESEAEGKRMAERHAAWVRAGGSP